MEKFSAFIKIRVLFWPEISALGVFFNFDNERMRPPKYPSAPWVLHGHEAYYIWCNFFITFVVDIAFGVIFILHLWLTVLSVSYYIWCNFFITFVVDITFGVKFLLHLRLILHLV